jgi:hypothetical protein
VRGPQKKQGLVNIAVIITFTDFLEDGTLFDLLDQEEALSEAEARF